MTHYQIQCLCLLLVPHQYSINAKVDHLEYNITLDDGCLQMDGYSYYCFFPSSCRKEGFITVQREHSGSRTPKPLERLRYHVRVEIKQPSVQI